MVGGSEEDGSERALMRERRDSSDPSPVEYPLLMLESNRFKGDPEGAGQATEGNDEKTEETFRRAASAFAVAREFTTDTKEGSTAAARIASCMVLLAAAA